MYEMICSKLDFTYVVSVARKFMVNLGCGYLGVGMAMRTGYAGHPTTCYKTSA